VILLVGIYTVATSAALLPMLRTPVIADDFVNPFEEIERAGPGLHNALSDAFTSIRVGASFRPVGSVAGSLYNWTWISLSTRTGLSMQWIYALAKLLAFIGCSIAAAEFWVTVSRRSPDPISRRTAILCVTGAAVLTAQLHGLWSNDPVTSYPMAGFASAALGFLVLVAIERFLVCPTWLRGIGAAILTVSAISFYELNVAALVGGACLMVGELVRRLRNNAPLKRVVAGTIGIAAPTIGYFILGHFAKLHSTAEYSGVEVRATRRALVVLADGLVTALPGSSWVLSERVVPGPFEVTVPAVLVAIVVGCVAVAGLVRSNRKVRNRAASFFAAPSLTAVTTSLAVLAFGSVALMIQAITVKVQDESHGFGYVYTSAAVSTACVALALAFIVRRLVRSRPSIAIQIAVAAIVVSFIAVQQSVNWRHSDALRGAYVANTRLLDAFSEDSSVETRCVRLTEWVNHGWPDYYRDAIVNGMEISYEYYFKTPFCPEPTPP
jgi:hypothetical protein